MKDTQKRLTASQMIVELNKDYTIQKLAEIMNVSFNSVFRWKVGRSKPIAVLEEKITSLYNRVRNKKSEIR